MNTVYVTSDWHLGHKGISQKFRDKFTSDDNHDRMIWQNARDMLTARDILICLGDMSFTDEGLDMIHALPGRKILVRGNHDTRSMDMYNKVFEAIHGAYRYKGCFLTHIPIHPMELYRGYNIHGHCHRGGPSNLQIGEEWQAYYNVILEFNDYRPVPMRDVLEVLKNRHTLHNEGE